MDVQSGISKKREDGKEAQVQRVDGVFLDYVMCIYVPRFFLENKK